MKDFLISIKNRIVELWVNHAQRYFVSSLITFTVVALPVAVLFVNENATWNTAMSTGFWSGLFVATFRAGVKGVWEWIVTLIQNIIAYLKGIKKE